MCESFKYEGLDETLSWLTLRLESVEDKVDGVLSLITNIESLVSKLDKPRSFDEFIDFRESINHDLDTLFSSELSKEGTNFRLSFSSWDVNFLIWDKEKKYQLESLLIKKQKIYYLYLLEAIETWVLDEIFNDSERNTIKILIKSRIFEYFNELFLLWKEWLYEWKNSEYEHPEGMGLFNWWLVDWALVSYKDILEASYISDCFHEIEDSNLRKYLNNLYSFLVSWETDYEKWSEIEESAIDTWEDDSTKLALNTPIETYQRKNVLVDIELELFLRESDNENKRIATDLSEKYFWDDYDIWEIKFSKVEPILSAWVVWFKSVLWKSFPNHPDLTEKRWTFIYAINSRLWEKTLNKAKWFIDALWLEDVDAKSFANLSYEEVAFHEYGHSLFIKWNDNSLLEETKASLFYFLKLYDENQNNLFDEEFIRNFLNFAIVEITRKVKNKDVPEYLQYVIREKLVYQSLKKAWLIYWDKDWDIAFNVDKKAFSNFLNEQKELLFEVQSIYFDDINWKQREQNILKDLDENVLDDVDMMYKKIIWEK